jgi:hypothetical protein
MSRAYGKHGGMLMKAEHWHERARHARTTAKFVGDETAERPPPQTAELYDQIAERPKLSGSALPHDRSGQAQTS